MKINFYFIKALNIFSPLCIENTMEISVCGLFINIGQLLSKFISIMEEKSLPKALHE